MVVLVFIRGLSVSFASCLLQSYLKVPGLECYHIWVTEDSLLRKVHLGFSSLFLLSLRIFHSWKDTWWSWVIYIFSPLIWNKRSSTKATGSRFPVGQRVLNCIRTEQQPETEKITPWSRDSHPLLQNGLFCLALHVYRQNIRAFHLKSNLATPSVLCFLNRMCFSCLFLLLWLAQINS